MTGEARCQAAPRKEEQKQDSAGTYQELWREGKASLERAGIEEARLDAWLLLEFATGITRSRYYAHPGEGPKAEEAARYRALIERRACREPVQQLTGEACFMGYSFRVTRDVLIPRQDTEVLAEEAIRFLRERKKMPGSFAGQDGESRILDLCTGSGCLLISLLLEEPAAKGLGLDISEKALCVARQNGEALGAGERAVFQKADLLSQAFWQDQSKEGSLLAGGCDVVVANPPYIVTDDIDTLSPEVRLCEPRLALDGGPDGLRFYRVLTREIVPYIRKGGGLFYEIGCSQGEAVQAILRENGFEDVACLKDLAGLDRVVRGRKP